jgi:hypothetical protein
MNQLEESILRGAKKAHKLYEEMTGGWWLAHGPESFFQTVVALEIKELGYYVWIDASHKKLRDGAKKEIGQPDKNGLQRPDISVWFKTSDKLRAAIEIKRAWSLGPIYKDAKKYKNI